MINVRVGNVAGLVSLVKLKSWPPTQNNRWGLLSSSCPDHLGVFMVCPDLELGKRYDQPSAISCNYSVRPYLNFVSETAGFTRLLLWEWHPPNKLKRLPNSGCLPTDFEIPNSVGSKGLACPSASQMEKKTYTGKSPSLEYITRSHLSIHGRLSIDGLLIPSRLKQPLAFNTTF